ncbi:SEC24 A COPII coat complex component [Fasciola hepatica]|uniref:SEC24 A COPII coat complex component n=1 Tax=Fasciola hepatica TaxID=6192 RepID=A0A4E0R9T6_FASHE|nr:SEC24 A COPII coat complex component [Fasciola hepatica]
MTGAFSSDRSKRVVNNTDIVSGSVLQHLPAPSTDSQPQDPYAYQNFQRSHPVMSSDSRLGSTTSSAQTGSSTTLSAAPEFGSYVSPPTPAVIASLPSGACSPVPPNQYSPHPAAPPRNASMASRPSSVLNASHPSGPPLPSAPSIPSVNRPMFLQGASFSTALLPPSLPSANTHSQFASPSGTGHEVSSWPHSRHPSPMQQYPSISDQMRSMPIPPPPTSFATSQPVPASATVHTVRSSSVQPPGYSETGSLHQTLPPQVRSNVGAYPPYHQGPLVSDSAAGAIYRSPGTPATMNEWSRVKAPIILLQDRELLPSDGPDLPVTPAITNPVNCDPDIMRCTLTNMPSSAKLLTRCRLPLGLVMHPFRDLSNLHTINSKVIVRCRSCRTYINPFVQFLDSGRRWRCPVCFLANSVPDDFYYDPGTQTYGDPSRRPEIRSATVEFIAPSEYMLRPPQPATYLFCFDVSRNAIATGYLRLVCGRLAALLNRIPGDSRRQIAFITYDSAIHFYKLCGDTMRLMICPDLDEPFLPDYEGLINRINNSAEAIQDFLRQLPEAFASTNDVGNCLGSVLQIGLRLIGGSGGRISLFTTSMPTVGAGTLRPRENPNERSLGEAKFLGPATDFYKTFALDCAAQQVAVDLFVLNSQYCDIATLSGVSRFSSGAVYHYPNFHYPPKLDQESDSVQNCDLIELERFRRDFDRYLTRKIGFEAVMRIRCTHGVSIQAFHGCFFVRSTDLMSLPNVSPDAGFAVQLNLTESVDKYTTVCCQAAILYTSASGDRRIRVHTLSLPVVHNPYEVFQGADQGAIACLIGKMAVDRAISSGVSSAREAMANSISDVLSAFSSAAGLSNGTMALPPNLRLLPLYVCGLLRYRAFRTASTITLDERSAALERLKSAPPEDMLTLIYPRLYALHPFISKPAISSEATLAQKAATLSLCDDGDSRIDASPRSDEDDDENSSSSGTSDVPIEAEQLPGQIPLTARFITRGGVYLLDTGELLLLLVGSGEDAVPGLSPSDVLQNLLGISSPMDLPASGGPFALPPLSTNESDSPDSTPVGRRRIMALIALLRRRRPTNNALVCMRHDAPANLKARFLSALVEDRTESDASYHEFLQMLQNLMKT